MNINPYLFSIFSFITLITEIIVSHGFNEEEQGLIVIMLLSFLIQNLLTEILVGMLELSQIIKKKLLESFNSICTSLWKSCNKEYTETIIMSENISFLANI